MRPGSSSRAMMAESRGCLKIESGKPEAGTGSHENAVALPDTDPVRHDFRPTRRNVQDAGLVGKFAVEVGGAGKSSPGLVAKKTRTARFRPGSDLPKFLPRNLARWTPVPPLPTPTHCHPIQDPTV